MKNLLLLLVLFVMSFSTQAQTFNRPLDPEKNVGLFGGVYTQVNLVDYLEFGVMGGVNFKDIVMVGPYFQRSVLSNNFYGLYTQVNFTPKEYYFTIGAALRTGFVNGKGISMEPGMTIQHNSRGDKVKFCHQIGFTGNFVSYNFGVLIGNFGEKWWDIP